MKWKEIKPSVLPKPAKWNSPTASICVPEHAIEHLLQVAKMLDRSFAQNSEASETELKSVLVSMTKGAKEYREVITLTAAEWETVDQIVDEIYADPEFQCLSKQERQTFLCCLFDKVFCGKQALEG